MTYLVTRQVKSEIGLKNHMHNLRIIHIYIYIYIYIYMFAVIRIRMECTYCKLCRCSERQYICLFSLAPIMYVIDRNEIHIL